MKVEESAGGCGPSLAKGSQKKESLCEQEVTNAEKELDMHSKSAAECVGLSYGKRRAKMNETSVGNN
jgi:hypothetical protein